MTDAEIRAYLIEAYTRGVLTSRRDYAIHRNAPCRNPRCPCRKEKN